MQHSFDKVLSMGSVDPDADSNYFATATEVSDFISMKLAEFDAAPLSNTSDPLAPSTTKDKLDVLGEQYFCCYVWWCLRCLELHEKNWSSKTPFKRSYG